MKTNKTAPKACKNNKTQPDNKPIQAVSNVPADQLPMRAKIATKKALTVMVDAITAVCPDPVLAPAPVVSVNVQPTPVLAKRFTGKAVVLLVQHFYGQQTVPGAMGSIRAAAREDSSLKFIMHKATDLENLEVEIATLVRQNAATWKGINNGSITDPGVVTTMLTAETDVDNKREALTTGLRDLANTLANHAVLRRELLANPNLRRIRLTDKLERLSVGQVHTWALTGSHS